jgi:hypothetical protein
MRAALAIAVVSSLAGGARADAPGAGASDDGYCDYVLGVAGAQSAIALAPELFGQVGYLEQGPSLANPEVSTKGLRVIAGVRYRMSGLYRGLAMRGRAEADCRRHRAFAQVRGETSARAVAARVKVLDEALREAEQILRTEEAALAARRATAQETTVTRVRVDELRALAAADHRQLSTLPVPGDRPLSGALAAYRRADADMEHHEARLRRAEAIDVHVRFGVDAFTDRDTSTPYFAAVSVELNLGLLAQSSANARAARGRQRLVESGRGLGVETTVDQLRATLEIEGKRAQETKVLVDELDRQLTALARIGSEDSKRYRHTVWFEWVKARAQHAYLEAHLASIREVLGERAP